MAMKLATISANAKTSYWLGRAVRPSEVKATKRDSMANFQDDLWPGGRKTGFNRGFAIWNWNPCLTLTL
jgi:hypothetical protein